jgi:outer membrane protein OmpA-like peptidoglycan-associated protein/pimeloyl-ACP methyl ester carboxylesterase
MQVHPSCLRALVAIALTGLSTLLSAAESHFVRNIEGKTKVIVFVHGVVGDSTSTWTNSSTGAYWPDLLVADPAFRNANIYVFQYPTAPVGRSLSINELAEAMRRRLEADGVLNQPELIFISHSMGGLVTRAFLVKYRDQASKVKMAYFYATPTEGSPAAALANLASRNPQFRNMYPLQSDNYLADLQRDWLAARLGIRSFCAYEGKTTYGVQIVDQRSASNLCTEPLDPILEDHIEIVKPANANADAYIGFKNAYNKTSSDGGVIPQADRSKIDHPVIDPTQPVAKQVQLFAEDRVRVFGPESLRRLRFGGPWEPFNPTRTYFVIGVPGQPVVPEFDPMPNMLFKFEVEYNKYVDQPRDLRSNWTGDNTSVIVQFESGQAILSANARAALDAFAARASAQISGGRGAFVLVIGHTDPIEMSGQQTGQKLSEQRAAIVADYLAKKGVSGERIEKLGMGKTQPLAASSCNESDRSSRSKCLANLRSAEVSIKRETIKR